MIYTIGHTESYERYFQEQGTPLKRGRCSGYTGGSVWRTREAAARHCPPDYSVYGIDADWANDTIETNANWHDLLRDAPIVKLSE